MVSQLRVSRASSKVTVPSTPMNTLVSLWGLLVTLASTWYHFGELGSFGLQPGTLVSSFFDQGPWPAHANPLGPWPTHNLNPKPRVSQVKELMVELTVASQEEDASTGTNSASEVKKAGRPLNALGCPSKVKIDHVLEEAPKPWILELGKK
uniref:Uncharacterized protein n=1 Tax=Cannabis sativa TaxID=3483 RepID=A0A803Q7B5_CANSA